LIKINNESKIRRSTTLKDLKKARVKRAEKDATKEAKGKRKRGRKPKNAILKVEEASADKRNRGRKRKNIIPEADPPERKAKKARISEALEPTKVPVARINKI
jgi:hypothetical protein